MGISIWSRLYSGARVVPWTPRAHWPRCSSSTDEEPVWTTVMASMKSDWNEPKVQRLAVPFQWSEEGADWGTDQGSGAQTMETGGGSGDINSGPTCANAGSGDDGSRSAPLLTSEAETQQSTSVPRASPNYNRKPRNFRTDALLQTARFSTRHVRRTNAAPIIRTR